MFLAAVVGPRLTKKTSNILRDVIGMFNAAIDNRKLLALEEVCASQM